MRRLGQITSIGDWTIIAPEDWNASWRTLVGEIIHIGPSPNNARANIITHIHPNINAVRFYLPIFENGNVYQKTVFGNSKYPYLNEALGEV